MPSSIQVLNPIQALSRRLGCATLALAATVPATTVTARAQSFINEFPRPALVINYDPRPAGDPGPTAHDFVIADLDHALSKRATMMELPLKCCDGSGAVVVNHDNPNGPKLRDVLDHLISRMAGPTMYGDNRQFYVALKVSDTQPALYDGVIQVMGGYKSKLSTAAGSSDPPRGLTFVITGESARFHDYVTGRPELASQVNTLAIVEGVDYGSTIRNRSADSHPFQWTLFQHDGENGRVNAAHLAVGHNASNVRIWDADEGDDLRAAIASGTDAVNGRPDTFGEVIDAIRSQEPRGSGPSFASTASRAVLAWHGPSDQHLWIAAMSRDMTSPRALEFTHFLSDKPLAMGPPAAAFLADKLLVVYEGTSNQRLWYLTGDFNSPNAMPTFSGREHRLTLPNDAGRRGSKPAVGVSPDKRVVVVYEGTNDSRLFYVTARLDPNTGELVGGEHSLTQGDSRRGSTPAIAFDNRGRAVIVYEGTGDNKLFYVTGRLDAAGNLIGSEHLLSQGDSRRGHRPSIAIDATGRVVVVYEGTNDQRLFYVCGRLDEAGVIQGSERSLTQGDARRGTHPTVALDGNGGGVIAYEGTGDRKLFYVKGTFNRSGQLVGDEHLVRIGMSP